MELSFKSGIVKVDEEKLKALDHYCQTEESDEFIVVTDNIIYHQNYTGNIEPIQLNSLTKVFAGTAVGLLLKEKQLDTLHTPLKSIFPSLSTDPKKDITIWHILTHTSGIKTLGHDMELSSADSCVEYVLSLELGSEPGKVSQYNNEAVSLIAGIVKRLSGEPLDQYLAKRIFEPLEITSWKWLRDNSGTPFSHWGLELTGIDLAKFAQLHLNNGIWQGQRLLSEKWIQESTNATQNINRSWGYLWLRYRDQIGNYKGYGMSGSQGKHLYIDPINNSFAIRLVHRKEGKETPGADNFFEYAVELLS